MATLDDIPPLDIREAIARIDQLQADAARKRQEFRFAPWQIAMTAMGTAAGLLTAGAALFAAGAAFVKLGLG